LNWHVQSGPLRVDRLIVLNGGAMPAVTAPAHVSAQHQKLLHFVGEGKWSDERVLGKVRELVVPAIERHGPIEAWIIDDTSYAK
jgi:SRSO17 transposase